MPLKFLSKIKSDTHETSEENKFLKWTEQESSKSSNTQLVDLRLDENGYILYWTDINKVCIPILHVELFKPNLSKFQKSDYLDIALIRDVRNGRYANLPKDKNLQSVLTSGQSNVPIEDKTISVYYGVDFVNVKCINFVSMAHSGNKVAKDLAEIIFKNAINPKTQNLSAWNQIVKLRSILFYGKAVFDEKTREYQLSIQSLVDFFLSNDKQKCEIEKQRIYEALKLMKLPCENDSIINEKLLSTEAFTQLFLKFACENIPKIFYENGSKLGTQWTMNAEQLEYFINEVQRDSRLNEILFPFLTLDEAANLIKKFEPDHLCKKRNLFSSFGFIKYLMGTDNEIVNFKIYELYDDMRQPLSHYFINSSHNTYLTGHQITGKSDVEIYRQALLSGCRCIELDCWDDDDLDEPIITHGRTLVTKIPFRDVIHSIKESAFKISPYPVLLSFENCCSEKMQKKMAKYLVEILGDMLLIEPLPQYPLNPGVPLPSPEELKYKIVVKNRKYSTNVFTESFKTRNPEYSAQNETETTINNKQALKQLNSLNDDASDNENETDSNAKEMSNLVNYMQPVKFRSFEHAESLNRSYEMSSFPEHKAYNLIKDHAIQFVNYNKKSFSRIYPKGTRISSDNYVPQVFWNAGCQLVALNFQTLDVPMQLNLAKFFYNNNCGYLLKPEEMRRIGVNQSYDPFTIKPLQNIQAQTATIQILSGIFFLEKRKAHTIAVEMFGLPADTHKGQRAFKTKLITSSFFSAVYNDTVLKFPRIIMPSLALLRFCAYDENNKFIGHRVIPLKDIRSGYRFICLRTESYQQLNACMIFANINVKNYVPEDYLAFADALQDPVMHISNSENNQKTEENEYEEMINDVVFAMLTESERHEKLLQLLTEEEIEEITHL